LNTEQATSISPIAPKRGWSSLDIREIRKYRELVYFLAWRDVKIRYKLLPVFVVLIFIAAIVGTLFAALYIRVRDVKFGLPFLLQVWMISSPIFYPAAIISGAISQCRQ